jgi:hypothetical protein
MENKIVIPDLSWNTKNFYWVRVLSDNPEQNIRQTVVTGYLFDTKCSLM